MHVYLSNQVSVRAKSVRLTLKNGRVLIFLSGDHIYTCMRQVNILFQKHTFIMKLKPHGTVLN